jgi:predicted transcriptional regulator
VTINGSQEVKAKLNELAENQKQRCLIYNVCAESSIFEALKNERNYWHNKTIATFRLSEAVETAC